MAVQDERNILHVGRPARPGDTEITPVMVEAVRRRVSDASGVLTVWAVLHEDRYESVYGDGIYLHVHGIALNSADANALAALAGDSEWVKWHVKDYRLGLKDHMPVFLNTPLEEITINDFVLILSEIPPGTTASRLLTGTGHRKDGPFVSLPGK